MLNQKDIYPIGIDITDQNIYAAQFQTSGQGLVVRHLFKGAVNGYGWWRRRRLWPIWSASSAVTTLHSRR